MDRQGSGPHLHAEVRAWIEERWGVVSRRELLDAGVTGSRIDSWVRTGRLVLLHRGVYALGHGALRDEGRWRAAVLAGGPGAVLSHRSAAALHGMLVDRRALIDISSPTRWRSRPGLRMHEVAAIDERDVVVIHHVPVTTLARTLVDLADTEPYAELRRAADALRELDLRALRAARDRAPGRRGAAWSGLLLERDQARTKSEMERLYLRFCCDTGLRRPERLNVFVGGCKIDALYLPERLAVELDGRSHHQRRAQMREDRRRDDRVRLAEHLPFRLLWEEIAVEEERAETVARQRALLALGARLHGGALR